MSEFTALVVAKSTESTKGGFVVTLKTDANNASPTLVTTPLGPQYRYPKLRTYYTKTQQAIAIGTKVELNLEDYDIVEQPFVTDDDKEITCKWLYLK